MKRNEISRRIYKERIAWWLLTGSSQIEISKKLNVTLQHISTLIHKDIEFKNIVNDLKEQIKKKIINQYSFLISKAMKKHLAVLDSKDPAIQLDAIKEAYKIHSKIINKLDFYGMEERENKDNITDIDKIPDDENVDWGKLVDDEKAKALMKKVNGLG